jgi:hypothetical protein
MSTSSSLPPSQSLKKVFVLILLGWLNNHTTQINLMTFISFYFLFYILQFISIFYNSNVTQDQSK